MAAPSPAAPNLLPTVQSQFDLSPDEWSRLEKRRQSVRDYDPPKWVSNHVDVVSGRHVEQSMVNHASILQCDGLIVTYVWGKTLTF